MEGRKTVMFWSSRCCTARCQMDSHFQQGAKCLSGAACMVWADWQNMKQLAQSIIGLCCCFYLSHSLQYLCFLFLLLSLFVYFFFCCWRCTPLEFSSDCLNNPTSFLFISVLLDVWSLDALGSSRECTVYSVSSTVIGHFLFMCVIWLPLRLLTKSSLVISALFGDEDCFYPKSMRFGFDSFSQSQHAQTNSHGLCLRIASNIWETSLSLDLFCCGFELYSGVWKRDLPLFAWTVGHLGRCQQRLIHFWCQGCIRGRDLVGQEFTDNIYMIAWHSYRHPPCSVSHFWQNFSWNVMKCLHIKQWGMGMKRFASLLHFVSNVILISRLSLSLEGDLEQIETTCGDARGMGVYMVLSLWQGYAKRCGVPGGSWWCLVAFQETKVAMEKSSSLGARGGLTYLGYFQL